LIIISSFLFYRYKTSKLKRDKKKLAFLVAERTKDLEFKNEALKISNDTTLEQKKNIEFLMKELSHRVKNNLQIISSLLNIQANTVGDDKAKGILKIAKNRILTISYIQSQLTTQTTEVDINAFIKDFTLKMLDILSDENNAKFEVRFNLDNDIICDINATLLGLILNELITNTFKYAFSEYNEINILEIATKNKDNIISLTITDNGKGYSTQNINKESLGLELINEMVNQLKGEISTKTDNGVVNQIEIPCK